MMAARVCVVGNAARFNSTWSYPGSVDDMSLLVEATRSRDALRDPLRGCCGAVGAHLGKKKPLTCKQGEVGAGCGASAGAAHNRPLPTHRTRLIAGWV